ncbi:aminoglycoside phosphotransferase family protein [Paenibacillus arenilitoris]|uniref:Phosphotransferase n=1 Tax=Paenibacillus arenilitoris TaxID=2772299 RepID=A0A927H6J6_9BACL|nr:phosphotransferase [Paenibacillus arenilitoris]MBD2870631.1 phosphotransferase [Paenibacillus arenilitoris]
MQRSDVNRILRQIQASAIIESADFTIRNRKGTTDGLVYTLACGEETKYVLKLDDPTQIRLAEMFLTAYRESELLPRLLYADPSKTFILYTYIEGTTYDNRGSKLDWMTDLVERLLNRYKPAEPSAGWGRIEYPCASWREFNERSLAYAAEDTAGLLSEEDQRLARALFKRLKDEGPEAKYLLHGDTGVHNFVYSGNKLAGVIDPSPMAGPVLYDFTYAFCSSPDDLTIETLRASHALLQHGRAEEERLIDEVVFQLYCRIGICRRHHPQDLDAYKEAWSYWKALVR